MTGKSSVADRKSFQRGERVRVRNDFVSGHIRVPGHIRGKTGIVMAEGPLTPFSDAHAHVHAHGLEAVA
ncbi:MAG: nitrile hydratase subunit beta [Alphaproteobacteria bacterium]|nr:nitrile hydratase subunit beta [Alphaproteobacteria bacterium]